MNTAAMNPSAAPDMSLRAPGGSKHFKPRSKFGPVGLVVMVGAHLLIGYALATGLARQALEIVKKPLNATIIQEVKLPPPPPPPPPKVEKIKAAPPVNTPPPPAYVPPPEVVVPTAQLASAITAVQSTQAVAPPPATPSPAAPPVPAPPAKVDIGLACPKQVKPEIPQRAIDDGIEGTVKAEARVRGGRVVEVRILSGPRLYHAAVRTAMLRYECVSGGDSEVLTTQDFTFKLD